jgi:hypothetical protein
MSVSDRQFECIKVRKITEIVRKITEIVYHILSIYFYFCVCLLIVFCRMNLLLEAQ